MPSFERIDGETVYEGRIFDVVKARFRHADGEVVERENVEHGGAVGIVVTTTSTLWLVRQPREGIMRDDVLEIPAGRLDVEGEAPEDAARRELAEELGLAAERVVAHDDLLHERRVHERGGPPLPRDGPAAGRASPTTDEDERIEVVRWPLADLDGAIDACVDAKTLIGLLLLRRRTRRR